MSVLLYFCLCLASWRVTDALGIASRVRLGARWGARTKMCIELPVLVVVGGGAAGYFGAIQAASGGRGALNVLVLEASRLPLQKVKISGGGRCNVIHDATKPVSVIAQGYPRGNKQLLGPLKSRFGPEDAAEWFRERGVALKTEADGRMFPTTDSSQTIIDCLEGAANDEGVRIVTGAKVHSVSQSKDPYDERKGFHISFTAAPLPKGILQELRIAERTVEGPARLDLEGGQEPGEKEGARSAVGCGVAVQGGGRVNYQVSCNYVLQATGSSREGHAWAAQLGHAIAPPVPSLFTLTIKDSRLEGLAGLSVQDAELRLVPEKSALATPQTLAEAAPKEGLAEKKRSKKRKRNLSVLSQRGAVLVTHTGMSGPAILKLSAFGARELSECGYKGRLVVNWVAGGNMSEASLLLADLCAYSKANPKKTVHTFCPLAGTMEGAAPPSPPPRRLWQSLARAAGVDSGNKWGELSKRKLSALARELTSCELQVVGKGTFKEEFVICGGVSLSEVDMRTMESQSVPGLFFAGEVLDIDGITGGYNFQSAWTTGWLAGTAIASMAAEHAGEDTDH
ncbi:unnamed protein product [Discosporangium mesarthrocarpum]